MVDREDAPRGQAGGDPGSPGSGEGTRVPDRVDDREPPARHAPARDTVGSREDRQRAEFGGFNVGAAFFGWLVAIGLGALLTALASAAGAAIGLTEVTGDEARQDAETIGAAGGILLVLAGIIGYYAGGYVAGRMSRFDGARQGFGVWIFGLLMTIILAVLGTIAEAEYNVLGQLDLPRIPVDEGDLTTGGGITLLAIAITTLLAAVSGGKVGERYHRKVDEAGYR